VHRLQRSLKPSGELRFFARSDQVLAISVPDGDFKGDESFFRLGIQVTRVTVMINDRCLHDVHVLQEQLV
jgi:hypothetical protein